MSDLVVIRPTRLDELRAGIDRELEAAVAAFRTSVAHAIRAGELLAEAKALVGHGHWLDWVDANFPASLRTAQNYMKLAKHREDAQRVAHLGVGQALRALGVGEPAETDAIEVAQEYALDEDEQAFVQCGAAFTEIRDRALYRAAAYPAFDAYVVHRWGLDPEATKSHMRARRAVLVIWQPAADEPSPVGDHLGEQREVTSPRWTWRAFPKASTESAHFDTRRS